MKIRVLDVDSPNPMLEIVQTDKDRYSGEFPIGSSSGYVYNNQSMVGKLRLLLTPEAIEDLRDELYRTERQKEDYLKRL